LIAAIELKVSTADVTNAAIVKKLNYCVPPIGREA